MSEVIKRELYEIWQEAEPKIPELSWRMQLINYVAQYPSREKAETHMARIIVERAAMEARAKSRK